MADNFGERDKALLTIEELADQVGISTALVVKLTIYDVLGQEVRVLASAMHPAGWYRVNWDGKDGAGLLVSSGVYLYRLEVGGQFLQTRKMVLVR